MKKVLMDILACPVCKGEFALKVDEGNDTEVAKGSLHCPRCNVGYPIEEGIPNLLPPEQKG